MRSDNGQLMVTVICMTYNHELYIRECLEGFVSQITTFPYEVFVHDDASTDNTALIIREYESKYPHLFRVVYESENHYQKKDGSLSRIVREACKGKYVAFCEGDDYWTDPYKLQKQCDILESHPELNICTHEVGILRDNKIISQKAPRDSECIIPVEEVIMGDGGFVGTNSILMRTNVLSKYKLFEFTMLDYFMQISGSIPNGMYYINEQMSIYRRNSFGSWTQRVHSDKKNEEEHDQLLKKAFDSLNAETDFKYDGVIKEHYIKNEFIKLCGNPNRTIWEKQYRKYLFNMSFKERIRVVLRLLIRHKA